MIGLSLNNNNFVLLETGKIKPLAIKTNEDIKIVLPDKEVYINKGIKTVDLSIDNLEINASNLQKAGIENVKEIYNFVDGNETTKNKKENKNPGSIGVIPDLNLNLSRIDTFKKNKIDFSLF